MAEQIIGISLNVDTSGAGKSVGSLKQQLREAQAEVVALSDKFGATSKEAINAAKKAADLRDRIGDAKALTDAFNPDAKFKAFTASLSAVAGGFGAVQGAMGLFGTESEQVEKTLLKVQSAMAISQGLQSIGEGIDSFKQLGAVIQSTTLFQKANNAVTVIATGLQKAFGVATVGVGRAFNVLKGAIAATGIGLLVVGIGALVSKMTELSDASEDAAKKTQDLNDQLEKLDKEMKSNQKYIDRQIQIIQNEEEIKDLRAKGGDQDAKISKLRKQNIEAEIKNVQDEIYTKQGLLTTEQELNLKAKEYQLTKEKERIAIEDATKAQEKSIQLAKERAAKLREESDWEEQQRQNQIESIKAKYAEAKELDAKEQERRIKQRENFYIESARINENWKTQQEESIKNGLDNVNKLQSQAEERRSLLANLLLGNQAVELANLDAQYEAKRKLIAGNEEAEIALTEEYEKKKKDINVKYQNQKLEIVQNGFNNIANIVGKQTAAGKAMAIASATIDTYQAANSALKADYGKFGPVSQVLRFIAVASTIATGIKSIKEIAKTKVPGGASVSTPSLPNVSTTAPVQPQEPQAMMTQLNQQSINQLGSATSRAYVVETDVTNSQERIKRINRAARLS